VVSSGEQKQPNIMVNSDVPPGFLALTEQEATSVPFTTLSGSFINKQNQPNIIVNSNVPPGFLALTKEKRTRARSHLRPLHHSDRPPIYESSATSKPRA
jgi:hypothetical protein